MTAVLVICCKLCSPVWLFAHKHYNRCAWQLLLEAALRKICPVHKAENAGLVQPCTCMELLGAQWHQRRSLAALCRLWHLRFLDSRQGSPSAQAHGRRHT